MKKTILALIVTILLISGCVASSPSKKADNGSQAMDSVPSWVTSPPAEPGYVYGIGMAEIYSTPAEAIMRAKENSRVELIKQLKVKVTGETTASVRREIAQGKSSITRSVFNYARSSIDETELPGIKVIKTVVSKKEKQVFALAELNLSTAEMDLDESLESIDKRIDVALKSGSSGSKINKIKKLLPVLKLIEERRGIVSNLRLISKMSDAETETEKHRKIIDKTSELLDSIVIVVAPDSSGGDEFASGIRKSLSNKGVRVRTNGSGDLYMKPGVSLNTVFKNDVFYTFATGRASVLDERNDIISEFSSKVKGASGDKALSIKRAVEKLADKLGNSIAKGIFESK